MTADATYVLLALVGACGGLVAGVVGLAGGIVIVPLIVLIYGADGMGDAIVVSFFAVFFNSLSTTPRKPPLARQAGVPRPDRQRPLVHIGGPARGAGGRGAVRTLPQRHLQATAGRTAAGTCAVHADAAQLV